MVGHLVVKDVDRFFPVSLSKKIISKILREKLNYDGVVITDDIKMQAISMFYGHKFATARALDVGNDMVMTRFSYKKDAKIIDKMIKRKMDEAFVNQKVERILKLKEKYSLTDDIASNNGFVQKMDDWHDIICQYYDFY